MTPDELREAGQKLYGRRWKAPLARRLKIDPATLWRYLQKNQIPERTALAVRALLTEKGLD